MEILDRDWSDAPISFETEFISEKPIGDLDAEDIRNWLFKMVITFNYKDGSETVSLSEIENSDLSSDLTASALPKQARVILSKALQCDAVFKNG